MSAIATAVPEGEDAETRAFPLRYARWLGRIECALRNESYRIANGHAGDLVAFDEHIATFDAVLAQYRVAARRFLLGATAQRESAFDGDGERLPPTGSYAP